MDFSSIANMTIEERRACARLPLNQINSGSRRRHGRRVHSRTGSVVLQSDVQRCVVETWQYVTGEQVRFLNMWIA